jgi:hypothetical protein
LNSVAIHNRSIAQVPFLVAKNFLTHDVPAEVIRVVGSLFLLSYGVGRLPIHVYRFHKSKRKVQTFTIAVRAGIDSSKRIKRSIQFLKNQIWYDLSQLNRADRARYLAKLSLYFSAFATGAYHGNELPDKDISWLGIGKHRNAAFHSVAAAVGGRLLLSFISRFVHTMESEGSITSDVDLSTIKRCLDVAGVGLSVGVATHLAWDGTVQGSKAVLFGEHGTAIGGTLADDRAWMLLNSFLCGAGSSSRLGDMESECSGHSGGRGGS